MNPNFPKDAYYQRFAYLPLAETERAERERMKVVHSAVRNINRIGKSRVRLGSTAKYTNVRIDSLGGYCE